LIDTTTIRKKSLELGFNACGFARAEPLNPLENKLDTWLENGCNGHMQYLEKNNDLRLNPSLLFPGDLRARHVRNRMH